jgi:hypothetical protein
MTVDESALRKTEREVGCEPSQGLFPPLLSRANITLNLSQRTYRKNTAPEKRKLIHQIHQGDSSRSNRYAYLPKEQGGMQEVRVV